MPEPRWVPRVVVEAVHYDQVREHGGLFGLRDEGALEAALARPRHKWAYKRKPDLPGLAAAYGYGLVRDHPFRDGNKRVGFLTMAIFLGLNGYDFEAEEADVVTTVLAVAAGQCSEAELARWIRKHVTRVP